MAAASVMTTRVNAFDCKLELNRHSAKGVVVDYQIILPPNETSMDDVIAKTEDLFTAICIHYMENRWKARLVALCEYERINNEGEVIGRETYHHGSYYAGVHWHMLRSLIVGI